MGNGFLQSWIVVCSGLKIWHGEPFSVGFVGVMVCEYPCIISCFHFPTLFSIKELYLLLNSTRSSNHRDHSRIDLRVIASYFEFEYQLTICYFLFFLFYFIRWYLHSIPAATIKQASFISHHRLRVNNLIVRIGLWVIILGWYSGWYVTFWLRRPVMYFLIWHNFTSFGFKAWNFFCFLLIFWKDF